MQLACPGTVERCSKVRLSYTARRRQTRERAHLAAQSHFDHGARVISRRSGIAGADDRP
jgi:hypothetical protein